MIAQNFNATTIRASQLTEGDIIQHGSDNWMVITEPEYTIKGITFEVLCLDVEAPDNTQAVCFAPESRFVLLDHQRTVRDDGLYCEDALASMEALVTNCALLLMYLHCWGALTVIHPLELHLNYGKA